MQGLQRFNHVAIMKVLPATMKSTFGIGLVLLGLGIYGAISGLIIGVMSVITAIILTKKLKIR